MLETRIKICGITSVQDAKLAHKMGADYLGVIFADSTRRVDPQTARAIRDAVPSAMLIGVFQDAPLNEVASIGRASGLNMIQLHGTESPDYCETLQKQLSLPIIKAFRANQVSDLRRLRDYNRISYFMLDLDKNHRSRNGRSEVDGHCERLWEAASRMRGKGYRIFLAGGLNPENVRHAIHRVVPYGIDVASGVENRPGVKDSDVLTRFFEEARR